MYHVMRQRSVVGRGTVIVNSEGVVSTGKIALFNELTLTHSAVVMKTFFLCSFVIIEFFISDYCCTMVNLILHYNFGICNNFTVLQ